MKALKYFITRGLWLTLLLVSLSVIIADVFVGFISLGIDCFSAGLTIIGSVLTILIFFCGIARDTKFMKNVYKYGKDKEFVSLCIVSLVCAFLSCIFSLLDFKKSSAIATYCLISSVIQLVGVTISMIKIIKFNNDSKRVESNS